jgi:SAM-dependent methyltransferase
MFDTVPDMHEPGGSRRPIHCRRLRGAALAFLFAAASLVARCLAAEPHEPAVAVSLSLDLAGLHRYLAASDVLTELPDLATFGIERLLAFEDHEHFAYIFGQSLPPDNEQRAAPPRRRANVLRKIYYVRPHIVVIDDQVDAQNAQEILWTLNAPVSLHDAEPQISGTIGPWPYACNSLVPQHAQWTASKDGRNRTGAAHRYRPDREQNKAWLRLLHVITFGSDRPPALPGYSVRRKTDALHVELIEKVGSAKHRTIRLSLPDGPASGRIAIIRHDDQAVVADRLLPAGILPPDLGAAKRRLQWDLPYQIEGMAIWDTRHASTRLKQMVEAGRLKPCRAVELGCGTGNDAIYLASRGFEVTAIDISPTALNIAQKKAAKAGVHVNWLLADILHPPALEPFDFVYDRGCYHEVRQHHAKQYVAAVERLTHGNSKILILAASANKDSYWRFAGPPRVREPDIRSDFAHRFRLLELQEFRFDPAPPERQGARAWSILLTRDRRDPTIESRAALPAVSSEPPRQAISHE